MSVRALRRHRRFGLGEFSVPSVGAFEDFESGTLVAVGGQETGWNGPGKVFTYNALVAFENFESGGTSSSAYPVFGWAGPGILTAPSIPVQPSGLGAIAGMTVSFAATAVNGLAPLAYQWQKNDVNLSNGGVVSGATTATLTLTSITSADFANYRCVVTDANGRTATSSEAALADLVTDWLSRIAAAGGATPSSPTQTAVTALVSGLQTDGVLSLMKGVCCFVPDNLIAAITPIVKGVGNNSWINHGFVSGDLTINGLGGNGANYLDTGIKPSLAFSSDSDGGLTAYAVTGNNLGAIELGATNGAWNLNTFDIYFDWSDGNSYWDCYGGASGRVSGANGSWAGYLSGNRTASNATALYKAKSGVAHTTVASSAGAADMTRSIYPVFAFARNDAGTPGAISNKRLSFAAIHSGLTAVQSANFFSRIQTFRTALGGGYL